MREYTVIHTGEGDLYPYSFSWTGQAENVVEAIKCAERSHGRHDPLHLLLVYLGRPTPVFICPHCYGEGSVVIKLPKNLRKDVTCPLCNGSGEYIIEEGE